MGVKLVLMCEFVCERDRETECMYMCLCVCACVCACECGVCVWSFRPLPFAKFLGKTNLGNFFFLGYWLNLFIFFCYAVVMARGMDAGRLFGKSENHCICS